MPRGAVRLVAAGATLVLATIIAGGVVAGTEKRGTVDPGGGAHMACGKEFPTCNGGVLPFGSGELVDIQLVHRVLMLLAVVAVVWFVVVAVRDGVAGRWPALAGALLTTQVLLGGLNVWFGMHPSLIVAHLALGTLLWAALIGAALALLPVPESRVVPARAAPVVA